MSPLQNPEKPGPLSGVQETTASVDALNEEAWEIGLAQTRRAYDLALRARRIARRLEYQKGEAYANRTLSYCMMFFNRMRESIELGRDTLAEFKRLGEIMGESTMLDILSNAYHLIGNYDQALQSSLEALTINRLIKYRRGEAWALNNIGNIWLEVGDVEQSERYFADSLEVFRAIGYAAGESSVLIRLGKIHETREQWSQALEMLLQGNRVAEQAEVSFFQMRSYADIGRVYSKLGDYDRALEYFRKSLRADTQGVSPAIQVEALQDLADLFRARGQIDKARRLHMRGLRYIDKAGLRRYEYRGHEGLSSIYEELGDYKQALYHERRFHAIKEEVFSEESGTKLRNMQIRLEVESAEKEAEIYRLRSVELKELNQKLEEQKGRLDQSLRQLQEDLSLARDIQQKILPDPEREFPGLRYHYVYQPLDQVGGDFLDIDATHFGRTRIFMADVVGHGVQASLITMALKSEYEELKNSRECPRELIQEMNLRIRRKYRRLISYVPAFLMDIDVAAGRLLYASAGTMDQLLLRGEELVRLPYSGPSLGILENPEIEKRGLAFGKGDRLLLFTDGITESFGHTGELFGEERIAGLLRGSRDTAVAGLVERLMQAMHEFRDTTRPHDDVTLIAIDPV